MAFVVARTLSIAGIHNDDSNGSETAFGSIDNILG